jgi:hypothetical protein
MSDKNQAHQFLRSLERHLIKNLPSPEIVASEVASIVAKSKAGNTARHMAYPEGAFLNHYIARPIHTFLASLPDMDNEKARHAFLSESFRRIPDLSSGSPTHSKSHPFSKAVGVKPRAMVARWKGETDRNPLMQSCPDMALRPPSPHKIIFEGKYFTRKARSTAENELVADIYQAFFYRGLAEAPETKRKAAWDYDYACLLAYDASETGALLQAWRSLAEDVRRSFWDSANIYVMILRGGS